VTFDYKDKFPETEVADVMSVVKGLAVTYRQADECADLGRWSFLDLALRHSYGALPITLSSL